MLTTGRLEAFSDGVFAIAITLLVLDLAVPPRDGNRSLASGLGHEWPSYFAYGVSFLVIGIIWINHHVLCTLVRRVDRRVLFANLFLLLTVSLIPFPTRVLAEYLTAGDNDAHVAAALYSGTSVAMAAGFTLMFLAINRDARLVRHPLDRATKRKTLLRFGGGGLIYAALIGLSFVSAVRRSRSTARWRSTTASTSSPPPARPPDRRTFGGVTPHGAPRRQKRGSVAEFGAAARSRTPRAPRGSRRPAAGPRTRRASSGRSSSPAPAASIPPLRIQRS